MGSNKTDSSPVPVGPPISLSDRPRERFMIQSLKRQPIETILLILCIAAAAMSHSCATQSALFNNSAATSNFVTPNGTPTPRALQVGFVNNTPFRAIFTFGAYDQLDNDTLPTNFGQLRLEGNTSSGQIPQPCRKTYSVGGAELIRLIDENRENPAISNIPIDENALIVGVNFSSAPLGDPLEAEPTEGTANGLVLTAGNDYTCARTDIDQLTGTGLLIVTFEQDAGAPGGFRIDFSFVAP